ncbi:MAG: carbamoyltransferase HypF [Bacteroidetes bacterium]|nr:carbamoyltransferase HypF [Bacteroidota bacterium]
MDSFEPKPRAKRIRLTVTGIVQGVGFRPYVYRLATECGLTGSVRNDGRGVEIDVQGVRAEEFLRRLPIEAPPLVLITDLTSEQCTLTGANTFTIIPSSGGTVSSAMIPADVATCDDCLAELLDTNDRRYRYPFINCTNCGPRYTITQSIPYDRPFTSMNSFPMCVRCAEEYHDPENRRFHAQPNACPDCGPQLRWHRNAQLHGEDVDLVGDAALLAALRDLTEGRIAAIHGLGGYHLAVDARNEQAVRLLRLRKRRYEKPLAVMLRDLDAARVLCEVSDVEAALLTSAQRPAVILRQKPDSGIAPSVSLDNPTLGVMLPYTPLHHLLLQGRCDALVMTSGNVSEEPICIDVEDAEIRLEHIADGFLHHDRDILQRCDDSVFRVIAGAPRPVRRARGYVPRPVLLGAEAPPVIAVGAELKNTLCVSKGRAAFLSQHIGDLENLETLRFFEHTLSHLLRIYDVNPIAIAHDLHPDYLGTQWAKGRLGGAAERFTELPHIAVQHHHAHLVSCLAENGSDEPAIGVILDGTGYGSDGTIWGGEFLVGNSWGFTRAGHFLPLAMPGGERAAREPWRMAFAAMHAILRSDAEAAGSGERGSGAAASDPMTSASAPSPDIFPEWFARRGEEEIAAARFALESDVNAPHTSSCGRLFDAVASLAGLYDVSHFEAQAAIALEFAADGIAGTETPAPYRFALHEETPIILSFLPAIQEIIHDMRIGKSAAEVSSRFHAAVVKGCAAVVDRIASASGIRTVALSGGSFQNAVLLTGLVDALHERNYTVLTHTQVPSNDGGIALGQAVIAHAQIRG